MNGLATTIRQVSVVIKQAPIFKPVAAIARGASKAGSILKSKKKPTSLNDGEEHRSFTWGRRLKDHVFKTKSRATMIIGGSLLAGGSLGYNYGIPIASDILSEIFGYSQTTAHLISHRTNSILPKVTYHGDHIAYNSICRKHNDISKDTHSMEMNSKEHADYTSCMEQLSTPKNQVVNGTTLLSKKKETKTHSIWGGKFNPLEKGQCVHHRVMTNDSLGRIVTEYQDEIASDQTREMALVVIATDSGIPKEKKDLLSQNQLILVCLDRVKERVSGMGWD